MLIDLVPQTHSSKEVLTDTIHTDTQGNLSATVWTIKKKVISRRDYHQWHNRLKEKSKSAKNNNEQSLPLHEITF